MYFCMTPGHQYVIFIFYVICKRNGMDGDRVLSELLSAWLPQSELIPSDTGIMRVVKQNL